MHDTGQGWTGDTYGRDQMTDNENFAQGAMLDGPHDALRFLDALTREDRDLLIGKLTTRRCSRDQGNRLNVIAG